MAVECERKFLVAGDAWRAVATPTLIRQGYLSDAQRTAVRVRIAGDRGFLTIKSGDNGLIRAEYEYPIPLADAEEMLDRLCARPLVEKVRYAVNHRGDAWVVDEFMGDNQGLLVAEIELDRVDQTVALPEWAGREVTDDPRYLNVNLARHPYSRWSDEGS
jgi:CYTH domain-containing protein